MKSKTSRIRTQRNRLWAIDPHCHWCGKLTVLPRAHAPHEPRPMPEMNWATIDHLHCRLHPDRLKPGDGQMRRVLACWSCNNQRNRIEMFIGGQTLLREFSGSFPATREQLMEIIDGQRSIIQQHRNLLAGMGLGHLQIRVAA